MFKIKDIITIRMLEVSIITIIFRAIEISKVCSFKTTQLNFKYNNLNNPNIIM